MSTFKFYNDAGLSAIATGISAAQAADGSAAAVDRVVYLGSTTAGKKLNTEASPGVNQITVSISDSAPLAGVEASHVKLALSSAGLASATPGAALSLGTQILSGSANAVAIHMRIDTPALVSGVYTDCSLRTNSVIEADV